MFKEGSNFSLPPSNSNKSVHYVTLTSTALEALEKAAQSKERATIQFIEDEGLIVLPQSQREGQSGQKQFSFTFAKDSHPTSTSTTLLKQDGSRLQRVAAFENKSIKVRNNLLEASNKIDTSVLTKEVKLKSWRDNEPEDKKKWNHPSSREKNKNNPQESFQKEKAKMGPTAPCRPTIRDKVKESGNVTDKENVFEKKSSFSQAVMNAIKKRQVSDKTQAAAPDTSNNLCDKKQRLENVRDNENQSRKSKSSSLDTDTDIIPKKKSRWDLPPSEALPLKNNKHSWIAPEKINAPEKRRHSTETGNNGNQKPPAISERTTPESGYGTGNSSRLTEFEEEEDRLQDWEELSEHTPYMKMKLGCVSMAPPPVSSVQTDRQIDNSLDIVKEFTSSTPILSQDSTRIPGVEEKHEKDIVKIGEGSKTVLDGSITKHPINVKNDRDRPCSPPSVKKEDKILTTPPTTKKQLPSIVHPNVKEDPSNIIPSNVKKENKIVPEITSKTDRSKIKNNSHVKDKSSKDEPKKGASPVDLLKTKYPPVGCDKTRIDYQDMWDKEWPVYMEQQKTLQARFDEATRLCKLPEALDPESSVYKKIIDLKSEQKKDPQVPHNKYLHEKLSHLRQMMLDWDEKSGYLSSSH